MGQGLARAHCGGEAVKIAIGTPVAERAWALPEWWRHLEHQTLRPDYYCFVLSPSEDATEHMLAWPDMGTSLARKTKRPFIARDARADDPKDPWRARHFAGLRNEVRGMLLGTDADVFITLDTDVMLTDPATVERMVALLGDGWDVVAARTCLHPFGDASQCYNAGRWVGGEPGSFDRIWHRLDGNDVAVPRHGGVVPIHIPMACYAMRRQVLAACKWKAHAAGEDLGFADALDKHHFKVGWMQNVRAEHVWGAHHMDDFRAGQEAVA